MGEGEVRGLPPWPPAQVPGLMLRAEGGGCQCLFPRPPPAFMTDSESVALHDHSLHRGIFQLHLRQLICLSSLGSARQLQLIVGLGLDGLSELTSWLSSRVLKRLVGGPIAVFSGNPLLWQAYPFQEQITQHIQKVWPVLPKEKEVGELSFLLGPCPLPSLPSLPH